MDPWTLAAVLLLAVLVGAAIPALLQLTVTLRESRRALARLTPRMEGTLSEIEEAARRVNRIADRAEHSAVEAQDLVESLAEFGRTLKQLRSSLRTATALGGAVGPAVAATVKTLLEWNAARASHHPEEPPAEEFDEHPRKETTDE